MQRGMSRRLRSPRRPRRFLVPPEAGGTTPPVAIYHVVSRVVDRQFVFGPKEKEQPPFSRMYDAKPRFPRPFRQKQIPSNTT
jgi:hypothetical protein